MPTIMLNDEIRALLGPEGIQTVHNVLLDEGSCFSCRGPLAGMPQLTAQVIHKATTYVAYAHAICAPPAIHQGPDDLPDLLPNATQVDMTVTAPLIAHKHGLLPTLILETHTRAFAADPGGDLADMFLSVALDQGLALIGDLCRPPRKLRDWTATLTPPRESSSPAALAVIDRNGGQFYTGALRVRPEWIGLASQFGWCVLYFGHIGIPDLDQPDDHACQMALCTAMGYGRVAGARIPITGIR